MIGFNSGNMINRCLRLVLILFASACTNSEVEVKLLTKNESERKPVSKTENVQMLYSDSGIQKARVKATIRESYMTNTDQRIIFPKGVEITFFEDEKGLKKSKLTAQYAISYELEDRMEAKNNVVVVNSKGEKLKTEHLIWDRRKRRIYSNVYTQIIKPNRILEGNSFESNETFTEYKITKLKGDIEINNE